MRWRKWVPFLLIAILGVMLLPVPGLPGHRLLDARRTLESARALKAENADLEAKARELSSQIASLDEATRTQEAKNRDLEDQLAKARLSAGLTEVSGPGVAVKISNRILPGETQPVTTVSDGDLLLLINELNAAGAEALSINGERVVATTEVRNAGPYISVNTQSLAAPFTIFAIGDKDTLAAAMRLYGGVVDNLGQFFDIRVSPSESLRIPEFKGEVVFRFAEPIPEAAP